MRPLEGITVISLEQAVDAYELSFDRGWQGLMSIYPCTIAQLKWWLQNGDKSQPFTNDSLHLEGKTIKRYRIVKELGRGGMGTVYLRGSFGLFGFRGTAVPSGLVRVTV